MGLVAVPVLRGDVQGAKELAAVFSGWIAAIVGFYFFQGQAQQAAAAAQESERERGETAMGRMEKALDAVRAQNELLRRELKEVLNSLDDHSEEGR